MQNIEAKLRVSPETFDRVRKALRSKCEPLEDKQVDSYFNCLAGLLKLRESRFESALIQYDREETYPKHSVYNLCYFDGAGADATCESIKTILNKSLGTAVVVEKEREIYKIGRAKLHLDTVVGLDGRFVEIEIRDVTGEVERSELEVEFQQWMTELDLNDAEPVNHSYSDLLLAQRQFQRGLV